MRKFSSSLLVRFDLGVSLGMHSFFPCISLSFILFVLHCQCSPITWDICMHASLTDIFR